MDQQTFNIKFQRIELLEKTMALNPGLKDGQQFNFNITAAPNIDLEKKLYVTFIKVNIMPIGSDLIMASVHVALGFEIEKFDEVFNTNEDGKTLIPIDLDKMLRSISISTTRGILASELRGTYLNEAILPIIDPNAFTSISQ